jgi:hypothetical protein
MQKARVMKLKSSPLPFVIWVFGLWSLVFGLWSLIFAICHLPFAIWNLEFGIKGSVRFALLKASQAYFGFIVILPI